MFRIVDKRIVNYLKNYREHYPIEDLKKQLVSQGWSHDDVDYAEKGLEGSVKKKQVVLKRLAETIIRPKEFFEKLADEGLGSVLLYFLFLMVFVFPFVLLINHISVRGESFGLMGGGLSIALVDTIMMVLIYFFVFLIYTLLIHGIVYLLQGRQGISRTYQAFVYSLSPVLLLVIIFSLASVLGIAVLLTLASVIVVGGMIYILILQIYALKKLQKISMLRSAIVCIGVPVMLSFISLVISMLFIGKLF